MFHVHRKCLTALSYGRILQRQIIYVHVQQTVTLFLYPNCLRNCLLVCHKNQPKISVLGRISTIINII